jgi:hypothetical protein
VPGQDHSGHRAQDRNFGIQESHVSHLPDKGTRPMVVKDLPVSRGNLGSPLELRSIEPYGDAIVIKQLGYGIGISPIPPAQNLPVQRTHLGLIVPRV